MIPIERTHEYRGLYHVLGGALSPIDGVDAEDLKIAELLRRVAGGEARARSSSPPTRPRPARRPPSTSPIACAARSPSPASPAGLPVGADLEHADEVTLGKALAGRRSLD